MEIKTIPHDVTIKEVMSVPEYLLSDTNTLADAIYLCRTSHDIIVVLDSDKRPVGYVSCFALLEQTLKKAPMHSSLSKIACKDFMIVNGEEQVNFTRLAETILRVPVFVCEDEIFKGIITLDALLSYYSWQKEVFYGFKPLMEKYECILNHCADSILLFDHNGTAVWGNDSSLDIIGRIKSSNIYESQNDLLFFPSIVRIIMKDLQPHTIIQRGSNGHTMVVTGTPIFDKTGKLSWIVTVNRDIDCLLEQIESPAFNAKQTVRESAESISAQFSEEARKVQQLYDEVALLRQNSETPRTIIMNSKKMQRLIRQAEQIAKVDSSVLLLGESGVGKDVIANHIHQNSPRCNAPFVRVNCGAIPESLFESELFGYEEGAFTGAKKRKIGFFELANGGTLFLDEVAEMPLPMQVKLLHVLQSRAFYRVGGSNIVHVDTRIIAATNKNLEEMVSNGSFREDLYYRLNVIPLVIPPVRERREDIPAFIVHFLKVFNQRYQRECQLSLDSMQALIHYDWPGNVRQIENTIERLVITAGSDVIYPYELPPNILTSTEGLLAREGKSLDEVVREFEYQIIQDAFQRYGTVSKVAEVLQVNRSTIYRKLQIKPTGGNQ